MKYLKCNFCKIFNKKEFNPCALKGVGDGNRCKYNTNVSVWKWTARIAVSTIPFAWAYWVFFVGVPHLSVSTEDFMSVGTILSLIIFALAIGIPVCIRLYKLHERSSGIFCQMEKS